MSSIFTFKITFCLRQICLFEGFFVDEDEPFLLTKLLEDILQIKINSLEKLDNELKISFVKEKSKRVDFRS